MSPFSDERTTDGSGPYPAPSDGGDDLLLAEPSRHTLALATAVNSGTVILASSDCNNRLFLLLRGLLGGPSVTERCLLGGAAAFLATPLTGAAAFLEADWPGPLVVSRSRVMRAPSPVQLKMDTSALNAASTKAMRASSSSVEPSGSDGKDQHRCFLVLLRPLVDPFQHGGEDFIDADGLLSAVHHDAR